MAETDTTRMVLVKRAVVEFMLVRPTSFIIKPALASSTIVEQISMNTYSIIVFRSINLAWTLVGAS